MPPVSAIVLTPKGRRKIDAFLLAVRQAAELGLAREIQTMRTTAASLAPSPEEEARLLSAGVAQDMAFAGEVVGTSEGGRFIRMGSQISLREAIATDPIVLTSTRNRVAAGTGSPRRINEKTGFHWRTRRRGIQGPTEPFNRAYVQAVEGGGAVWVVTPRPGTRALEPEDGIVTRRMVKTMPPFGMFSRTAFSRRPAARAELSASIQAEARKAGRA